MEAEVLFFDYRLCGDRLVLCDGECQLCQLRLITTTDGKRLFPGKEKGYEYENS